MNYRFNCDTLGSFRAFSDANYLKHLFLDILVALSNTPASWQALEQTILIAQREGAAIHGLHVVRSEAERTGEAAQDMQTRFLERCAAAKITSDFAVETGDVTSKIIERARLADLVVLHLSHPPTGVLSTLTSGWRAILRRAARPVLALPGDICSFQRAGLIFDGSPKSREALFVAAYLAESWRAALTVITAPDSTSSDAFAYARADLELHELEAHYVHADHSSRAYLNALNDHCLDVLLLGSDSGNGAG